MSLLFDSNVVMRVGRDFFKRDALLVAPEILGMFLLRRLDAKTVLRVRITEVEAYRGEEDRACHACKGRTPRTRVMYDEGGVVYVYLIYGIYWMLNLVTGLMGEPQALLIRGVEEINGPGRLGVFLKLDRSFYGEDLEVSSRLWLESDGGHFDYSVHSRVGIDYAGDFWRSQPWRFVLNNNF